MTLLPFLWSLAPALVMLGGDPSPETTLPIKRVVLYKHGVGYFEHAGRVTGNQTLSLSFSQSEMNDVLKSLTALDLSGGSINTIGYDSKAPPERLLAQFGFALPDDGALIALLARLRGAQVQVTSGQTTITGGVLGIETRPEVRGEQVAQVAVLSVFTDDGRVQSVPVREITGLRFTDEALSKDLARYLEIMRDTYHRDRKAVQLRADGEGERELFVSYVLETPVWKVSYRLLLGEQNLLQGWAIVDNTSQTDWNDVELSLVSGLPVSFVQDLYSPRYKRRPVVRIEEELALAPQTHEGGWTDADKQVANAEASDAGDDSNEIIRSGSGAVQLGRGARGRDEVKLKGLGYVGKKAGAPEAAAAPRPSMSDVMQQQEVQTATREVGDLFEYKIAHPVSVGKDRSALIPILTKKIDGKKVALYNASVRGQNPLSAFRLKNTSGLTLEGGPIQVLEHEAYAGEALIDTVKAGDERYITYAVDLAVTVDTEQGSGEERVVRVSFLQGTMRIESDQLRTTSYTLRNGDQVAARELVIEHPRTNGYDLVKPEKPLETTPSFHRLALDVPAAKTVVFPVVERARLQNSVAIGNVTLQDLEFYVSRKLLSTEMEKSLRQILDLRQKVADLARQMEQRQRDLSAIAADEDRIRKNLQSLGTTGGEQELRGRYVAQLAKNEDRINTLKEEVQKLEADKAAVQAQLDQLIRTLVLEYKP